MADVLPRLPALGRMALDFLFPRYCVGCGRQGDFLCPVCSHSLEPLPPRICSSCGLPLPGGGLCTDCLYSQPVIDGIRSPYRFMGVIRRAIHQFKYQDIRALANPLARLLCDYLENNPLPAEVLLYVPLHRSRLRERGYNQSGLLARELSRMTGLHLVEGRLERRSYALPQAKTGSALERKRNVAGSFVCPDSSLAGKQVLLVDDVATSGATLDSCAEALKKAGAMSVWGLTVAREV